VAQPRSLARETRRFGRETARIVRGRSRRAPAKNDKRFADPAWSENPVFRRLCQEYLNLCESIDHLLDDKERSSPDWQEAERARFFMNIVSAAVSPTNLLPTNPAALKRLFDTGGMSLVRGVGNLLGDVKNNGGMPSQTNRKAFQVGTDLAATPGAVVHRDELAELIQYAPQTETVRQRPVIIIPPPIGRYYFLDLRPGRSFVEHAVKSGLQVFMISWRNPDQRHGDWGLDTYGQAILDAMDAVERATGCERVALQAFCSGGIITAMVLAHLAATGRLDRVAAASFAVTVLDWARAGTVTALMDPEAVQEATEKSRRKGYLDGAMLAEVFAWLRPNDLVWNYWVNNYLQGKPPAAFDILFWNADTTRMSAALHRDFIEVALGNALTEPGRATMLGTPVDLSAVDVDAYVTAGIADHLCPWQACYRTTQMLGGDTRFVLSTNGHIASLVNPPGNPKSTFQVAPQTPEDPEQWLAAAHKEKGSWWPDFMAWLGERAGDEVPAPQALGSADLPVLGDAPGTYVFDK